MLLNSSVRCIVGSLLCKLLFVGRNNKYYFFDSKASDCIIKFVLIYEGKILLAKQKDNESLSKVCLPYGSVDLKLGEDNASACERISFDRLNLRLDGMFFDSRNLINAEINYKDGKSELVYVYKYTLSEGEFSKISDSYIFYDFFLLDLECINEYKDKNRFVSSFDSYILEKLHEKGI